MFHKTSTFYTDKPNLSIRWDKSTMTGTMTVTSYTFEILTRTQKYQWSFVWRPDVTVYWWKNSDRKGR
jgi:hypothetical protein